MKRDRRGSLTASADDTRARLLCVPLLAVLACTARGGATTPPEDHAPPLADAPTPDPIAAEPEPPEPTPPEPTPPAPATPTADEPPSLAIGPEGSLTDEQRAIFFGSPEDPVPEHRGGTAKSTENLHYLSGNERALQAFHSTLDGIGGGYLGVGTDQAYLFLGWARFDLAWLVDYDPAIQHVHALYFLFFERAQTPREFITLWSDAGRDEALAAIDAAHQGEDAKALRYWYKNGRKRIHSRFLMLRHRLGKAGVPSFLDDQEIYTFVRERIAQGRVRPLLVNLLQTEGLAGVARSSRELGVPIRVLYLSNAEQYWKRYSDQYRDNVAALPFAEDALVLRTITSFRVNDDYRYNVQPAANYVEWLQQPYVGNYHHILHAAPKATPEGITFFRTESDPQDSPRAQRYRQRMAEAGG